MFMLRGAIGMWLAMVHGLTLTSLARRFHSLIWWVFGITVIVEVPVEVAGPDWCWPAWPSSRWSWLVPQAIFSYNSVVHFLVVDWLYFHFCGLFRELVGTDLRQVAEVWEI
jgi:hypothetical protein